MGGDVTNFGVLDAFRFTMVKKDSNGVVRQKVNMAAKNKELMLDCKMSYTEINGDVQIYIKGNTLYTYEKQSGGIAIKMKTSVSANSFETSLTNYGLISMFANNVSQLKDSTSYTITKNGTNFKFVYKTVDSNNSAIVILQMDNENNVKAIHVESSDVTGSTEMTFCEFDGNLEFPDLSGYISY